jgi:hypothetical protein
MIFFKKRNIVVDAFTARPAIFDTAKIQEASKFLPEWWKKLPSKFPTVLSNGIILNNTTMKKCDGFIDLYRHGMIIPMWCDLTIKTTPESYSYMYSGDKLDPVVSHGIHEYGEAFDDYMHLKITSPWLFSEKSGVKFHFTSASWSQIKYWQDLIVVPGIVDYKYQTSTNINVFVPKINNQIELSHGQPMVHIIPLSEYNIEIRNHLISDQEWLSMLERHSWKTTLTGRLRLARSIGKEQGKCPFGFGK